MAGFYTTNFAMIQYHGWSLSEIENLLPFEREIYLGLTEEYVKTRKEALEKHGNG